MILELLLAALVIMITLKILQSTLPSIHSHLSNACQNVHHTRRNAFSVAQRLVTQEGKFSTVQAIGQIAGAVITVVTATVYVLSDLQFTFVTLADVFGLDPTSAFIGYERLLGFVVVSSALFWGVIITDLVGWTFLTRLALIERGRVGAFCIACGCLTLSFFITLALAFQRVQVLGISPESAATNSEPVVVGQFLSMFILTLVAALLFFGTVFVFIGIETAATCIAALAVSVGGVFLGALGMLLSGAEMLAGTVADAVASLSQGTAPLTNSLKAFLLWVYSGLAKLLKASVDQLNIFVQRPIRGGRLETTSRTEGHEHSTQQREMRHKESLAQANGRDVIA